MLVPKLRFPLFFDKWDYQKLGNVIDLFSGIALKSEEISEDPSGIPILRGINITEGRIRHSKEIDRFFQGNINKIIKYYVKEHDLVLGMDGSKVGRNVALITKKDENSILIQRVSRIRSKSNSNIIFIYQHIFSKKFHDYVDIVNTSSGIPHISLQQIKDFQIGFPSLPEQHKIASFLSTVDEKIQLLKKQQALLEQYKKGVMQKIFSREIRFKDEDGNEFPEWEERRLGEICDFFSGGTPRTAKKEYYNGSIPFIKSGEINSSETSQCISEIGFKNSSAKMVSVGDILYALYGATSGEVAISKINGAINQAVLCIKSKSNHLFLYYYLSFMKDNIISTYIQGGQGNLSANIIKELNVPIPCIEEQQKIAYFLSSVDNKKEKNKDQIRKMELWKKGLLQQMFC
jgi:type I restriction enzyme S subunit